MRSRRFGIHGGLLSIALLACFGLGSDSVRQPRRGFDFTSEIKVYADSEWKCMASLVDLDTRELVASTVIDWKSGTGKTEQVDCPDGSTFIITVTVMIPEQRALIHAELVKGTATLFREQVLIVLASEK
jgi:hypothetical protein